MTMGRVFPSIAPHVRSTRRRTMARRRSRVKAQLGVEALESRALMSTYGVVLKGPSIWGGEPVFTDLRHILAPWGSNINGGYQSDPTIPLTPQGYPIGVGANPGSVSTGCFVGNYPDGVYQVSYSGKANLFFDGVGRNN